MSVIFQAFVQVFSAQGNRVLVKSHIFKQFTNTLPQPSLVSVGNFHTLRRYFETQEQAEKWAALLHQKFSVGSARHPLASKEQQEFNFSGVSE
jgi:hypothetical protein